MTRFTIAQIIPKLSSGGAERSAIEISQAVVQVGHRALIIGGRGIWSDWAESVGAECFDIDMSTRSPLQLRHALSLRQLFLRENVDLVHSRSRLPSWLTYLARKSMRKPPRWVTTVHGQHSVSRYSAIQHKGEAVIAVSASTRDFICENYGIAANQIRVIERGIDSQYHPGVNDEAWRAGFYEEFPALRNRRILVLPGRGTRLKGHVDALYLVKALLDDFPELMLFCPGFVDSASGSYLREIEALAKSLQIRNKVILSANRDDLPQIYKEAALMLQLSNRAESFGRTVAEALACGLPVLGLALGGVGDQLRHFFPQGLAPAKDSHAVAACARKLLRERPTIEASGIPTLAQMQAQTLAVYSKLLAFDLCR